MPGTGGDVCCCDTPSGDQCNWMICPECYLTSVHDLGALHQILSKQVSSIARYKCLVH